METSRQSPSSRSSIHYMSSSPGTFKIRGSLLLWANPGAICSQRVTREDPLFSQPVTHADNPRYYNTTKTILHTYEQNFREIGPYASYLQMRTIIRSYSTKASLSKLVSCRVLQILYRVQNNNLRSQNASYRLMRITSRHYWMRSDGWHQ